MNKTLKFRVYDNINKKWLLGYKECGGFSINGAVMLTGEWQAILNKMLKGEFGKDGKELFVQQYTGAKDRTGVEIYEGDIIKWGMSHNQEMAFPNLKVVEFYEPQLIYKMVDIGDLPVSVDYLYEAIGLSTRWCEVVGNVYENPELLES